MCCRWGRRASRGAFGEDGDSGDPERTCSQGGGSYLTVHNGLLFLQLDLLLSCLSTQQSLQDRPFRKATLLLQGYLTIWGQSTGKVVSIEEAVTRVPRLGGRWTGSLWQGQALPHPVNKDIKIQPQTLGRHGHTLALLTEKDKARTLNTPRNPQKQSRPS